MHCYSFVAYYRKLLQTELILVSKDFTINHTYKKLKKIKGFL